MTIIVLIIKNIVVVMQFVYCLFCGCVLCLLCGVVEERGGGSWRDERCHIIMSQESTASTAATNVAAVGGRDVIHSNYCASLRYHMPVLYVLCVLWGCIILYMMIISLLQFTFLIESIKTDGNSNTVFYIVL